MIEPALNRHGLSYTITLWRVEEVSEEAKEQAS
jgi:hypothetical protein